MHNDVKILYIVNAVVYAVLALPRLTDMGQPQGIQPVNILMEIAIA